MEILLWLVPAAVATLASMVWVTWLGREGRGQVDREVAVARLGKALTKEHPTSRSHVPVRDRSTGIAVRPTSGTSQTRRSA